MVKKMQERQNNNPLRADRRSFLTKIWVVLGLVALVEYVGGGISFFISGRRGTQKDSGTELIDVGAITDFLPGTVTYIPVGNCYLSRLKQGGMLAISRKCTHLGCAVPWITERHQFECPCHASVFDKTGSVVKSPAPRALDLYPLIFAQNRILVDLAHPVQRTEFTPDQLSHPGERS